MNKLLYAFGFFTTCALTGMGVEALGVTLYGWEASGAGLLVGVFFGSVLPLFYWIVEG